MQDNYDKGNMGSNNELWGRILALSLVFCVALLTCLTPHHKSISSGEIGVATHLPHRAAQRIKQDNAGECV